MDSVGYPEFEEARTPNIGQHSPEQATAFAPYTMPSIQAMLRGSMPQPINARYRPYKNYVKSEHAIIPLSLENQGYNTYIYSSNINITNSTTQFGNEVVGGYGWFQNEHINLDYGYTGKSMVEHFIEHYKEPFYAFFLFIDTHTPYGGRNKDNPEGYLRENQIRAVEKLDRVFKKLYRNVPEDTRIIVTSDHSDCWVDGVRFGHNPLHYSGLVGKGYLRNLLDVFIVEVKK